MYSFHILVSKCVMGDIWTKCICVCIYRCTNTHTHVYVCIYIYVCVCVCVCVCVFPLPIGIYQVSLNISLELITLWGKAAGKINVQRAEGESPVLLSFLCFTFCFINSSRNTLHPYKICCPNGFCFCFQKQKENRCLRLFLMVMI